ncbi:beta-propeller fold lactonase family protein [Streptomyces sp. CBMA123]|uniref:beta-propeller fold lactonase family protein n=1 Tax=Streptomyces sp. CBMA123 TaxID=1896313 RepID=UPI0016620E3E
MRAGAWPRGIVLAPDGRLLFCANQRSDSLTAFRLDPSSGALALAGELSATTEPPCILPVGSRVGRSVPERRRSRSVRHAV